MLMRMVILYMNLNKRRSPTNYMIGLGMFLNNSIEWAGRCFILPYRFSEVEFAGWGFTCVSEVDTFLTVDVHCADFVFSFSGSQPYTSIYVRGAIEFY